MNNDTFARIIGIVLVLAFFALAGACEVAQWNECRRYHPGWYCFVQAGKK